MPESRSWRARQMKKKRFARVWAGERTDGQSFLPARILISPSRFVATLAADPKRQELVPAAAATLPYSALPPSRPSVSQSGFSPGHHIHQVVGGSADCGLLRALMPRNAWSERG